MFVEEITRIRESEAKADELQKNAKLESKKSLSDAKAQAARMVEEAELKAKEIYDTYIQEGQDEAERQYEQFLKDTHAECDDLIAKAKDNEDKAVELIAERIVRNSVDQ